MSSHLILSGRVSATTTAVARTSLRAAQIQSLALLSLSGPALAETLERAAVENPFLTASPAAGRLRHPGPGGGAADHEIDALVARPAGLWDALAGQIAQLDLGAVDRAIAAALLGELEPDGYYRGDLPERAAPELARRVDAMLRRLQALQPRGVFSRSLPDFLALQLRERALFDPIFSGMLSQADLLAAKDVRALSAACGCPVAEIATRIAVLSTLDPAPYEEPAPAVPQTVAVELAMRPDGAGGWQVEHRPGWGIDLRLDHALRARLTTARLSDRDRGFVSHNWREAIALVSAVERRAVTLARIGGQIIDRQGAYLSGARPYREGLQMREVAARLGLHESTVSRAVAGKFIACPIGTVALRDLFVTGLRKKGCDGGAISDGQVKARIAQMIAQEYEPLSDQSLAELLRDEGLPASRRTVAKYRAELRLPPSHQRRRTLAAI